MGSEHGAKSMVHSQTLSCSTKHEPYDGLDFQAQPYSHMLYPGTFVSTTLDLKS